MELDLTPIQLQSPVLQVSVIPALGAVVTSILDRLEHEYMADGLHPRPEALPFYAGFNDAGLSGMDDCIPAISAGVYPAEPFQGWNIPDHGEVWQRPWQVIRSTDQEVELSIRGSYLPYKFVRRMIVEESSLRLEYSLVNESRFDLPIVWACHPMLRATPKMQLCVEGIDSMQIEASNFGYQAGAQIAFPVAPIGDAGGHATVDFRKWDSLPQGAYVKMFAPLESGQAVTLHYPEWNTSLQLTSITQRNLQIGIWLNKGGFPVEAPLEHLSLEPTFGSSDSLERAYQDGSCLTVGANATERWTTIYQVLEHKA